MFLFICDSILRREKWAIKKLLFLLYIGGSLRDQHENEMKVIARVENERSLPKMGPCEKEEIKVDLQ